MCKSAGIARSLEDIEGRMIPVLHRLLALALLCTAATQAGAASKFDLSDAQRKRLEQFLPRTAGKLMQKAPVHVLIVGDSVSGMYVHDQNDSDTLKSYGGIFLSMLADQFYYTGGLRVVRPGKGMKNKSLDIYGQELTVRNASRGGKLMIHAMNVLSTVGWEEDPDLVIVCFGINDANSLHSLARYRKGVEDVIASAKEHKADLMLLGSTPTLTDPPELGLSLTRPYVDTVREVAQNNGVFFADLGDISWLVRVDEPFKELERPAQKKTEEKKDGDGEKKQPDAPTPGAIINFPSPQELDPDPEKRAARLFHQVVMSLRDRFDHSGQLDAIHPNSGLHRLLGRRLFAELLDGPRKTPWTVGRTIAEITGTDQVEVSFRVENSSDAPLRVNVLPLVTQHWKPQAAEAQVEIQPGRKQPVKVTYARVGGSPDAFPPHEAVLRLPVMVLGAGMARIEELDAIITPLAMQWETGAQFNKEGEFTINGKLSNTSAEAVNSTWEAEWNSQKLTGSVASAPRSDTPVKLTFKLPAQMAPPRATGPLQFKVKAGNLTQSFNRNIEIVANIGLKQPVKLFNDRDEKDGADISFRVDADPSAIYFTWDVKGYNLVDDPSGNAIEAEVNLDARSYGKRLGHGVTDAVRLAGAAADGDVRVFPVQPWAFGNGYGTADIKTNLAQAHLSSRPDGGRRLTLMLPRNFFTLHEWAIGNGNSQFGISTTLNLWRRPDDKNPNGSFSTYVISSNGMHRDDAEALSALELSEKSTARWTVHIY